MGPGRHDLTLDRDLQAGLEKLARRYMSGRGEKLSVALVLADHQSGEILASVGSKDYTDMAAQGFVDMTTAQRSPGSTLKPLVYGLAFDRGLAHPETLILDTPVQFGTYAPQNFDGEYRGELPVRRALQLSLNIPVVRLTEALGPAHLMAALERAMVDPGVQGGAPGLALALGGVGLTLEEMVQLYAALARGGEAIPLRWRARVDPDKAPSQRVLSRTSAWQVGNILADLLPPPRRGHRGAWLTRQAHPTGIAMPGHWVGPGNTWRGSGSGGPTARLCLALLAATWRRRYCSRHWAASKAGSNPCPRRRLRRCWSAARNCPKRCSVSARATRWPS
ncbi:hypothetical protein KU6B_00920 [Mameliella alba]|nr:hypothetical protein KU6B_00920 [Mameliella alba]